MAMKHWNWCAGSIRMWWFWTDDAWAEWLGSGAANQQAMPQIKIIILSMYDDEGFVLEALANGALAYVPKTQALLIRRRCVK